MVSLTYSRWNPAIVIMTSLTLAISLYKWNQQNLCKKYFYFIVFNSLILGLLLVHLKKHHTIIGKTLRLDYFSNLVLLQVAYINLMKDICKCNSRLWPGSLKTNYNKYLEELHLFDENLISLDIKINCLLNRITKIHERSFYQFGFVKWSSGPYEK